MNGDIVTLLGQSSLFRDLPTAQIQFVANRFKREILHRGAFVYRKGDPGDKLFMIVNGQVTLLSANAQGKDVPLVVLGRGEVFGESGLLTDQPRSVSARLESTTDLISLGKKEFNEILSLHPSLAVHLSRILSRRLALTTETYIHEMSRRQIQKPKLILLLAATNPMETALFTLNLTVSVMEQTRRRVSLLEFLMEPKSSILQHLGIPKEISLGFQSNDKSASEILDSVKTIHPSGLDIFTIAATFFSTPGDNAFSALNYLRAAYEFTLIIATPLQWNSLLQVAEEVDQIFVIGRPEHNLQEQLIPKLHDLLNATGSVSTSIHEIQLITDGRDSFINPAKLRLGWAHSIAKDYDQNKNPFTAVFQTKTLRSIERVARFLANLKIGIALGSGGALGYSLIGVLKALERERIYPDMIAGTSMGALVGAMYARGLTIEEIENHALMIDRNWIRDTIFWDMTLAKGGGFLGGIKLQRFFRKLFDDLTFEDLEIPFCAVAADIKTSEEVIIKEGRLIDAVRASISIPVIFKPHQYLGRFLVDGGVVNPVPTSTIISMGANILIAVRLTHSSAERGYSITLLGKKEEQSQSIGVLDVFFRTIGTMSHLIAMSKAETAHVTIHPVNQGFNWMDFDRPREIIAAGEKATLDNMPQIKALLPIFQDYCATRLKI
ncbi:MAG: patatin-like phospholipase family protein [Elusimicrobia bacterium]|nr:patatin-like phospholipase family protein [Elusimicrobiota bacterium]